MRELGGGQLGAPDLELGVGRRGGGERAGVDHLEVPRRDGDGRQAGHATDAAAAADYTGTMDRVRPFLVRSIKDGVEQHIYGSGDDRIVVSNEKS